MAIDRQPSCDDVFEPALLPVEVARQRLFEQVTPLTATQTTSIRSSLDRICSENVRSPIDVPGYTNSAMDGVAVNHGDMPREGERQLKLVATVWAGHPYGRPLLPGEAVRIMTGGMMPQGSDTVIIQEHVNIDGDIVTIDGSTAAGKNVRHAGEDIKTAETVIPVGTRLTPAHIGLMASLGIDQVQVFARPRVAFFSTGDELRALETHAGQSLGDGELFDSNRHTLASMLERLEVETIDLGLVPDTAQATREVLQQAATEADLIISSGGVSAGAADFISSTLAELGEVAFWKLAMRPGRPLAYGRINNAHFFGLPGNPVAVMVTFYQFVQPAVLRLMGANTLEPVCFDAISQSPMRKTKGRVEYQRGILSRDESGELTVATTGKQGAGRLSSMCVANCLVILPVDSESIAVGDRVQVQPFFGLV